MNEHISDLLRHHLQQEGLALVDADGHALFGFAETSALLGIANLLVDAKEIEHWREACGEMSQRTPTEFVTPGILAALRRASRAA